MSHAWPQKDNRDRLKRQTINQLEMYKSHYIYHITMVNINKQTTHTNLK